jgi:hypothetical protein
MQATCKYAVNIVIKHARSGGHMYRDHVRPRDISRVVDQAPTQRQFSSTAHSDELRENPSY